MSLGWPSPTPDGPALSPDLLITRVKNILDLKTRGELVIFSVFRFVTALVCREQIPFLNSSRNQEQPRPGTAGGALVSKLPSWRRSALSRIFRAASVGIADVGFCGRSGSLVLVLSLTGCDPKRTRHPACIPDQARTAHASILPSKLRLASPVPNETRHGVQRGIGWL